MSEEYPPERREFVRVQASIPVQYWILLDEDHSRSGSPLDGLTRNLSGGGLLLEGPIPDQGEIAELLLGRKVIQLRLALPGAGPLGALGRVAWIEGRTEGGEVFRIGIAFRDIAREDKDLIFRYVIGEQLG